METKRPEPCSHLLPRMAFDERCVICNALAIEHPAYVAHHARRQQMTAEEWTSSVTVEEDARRLYEPPAITQTEVDNTDHWNELDALSDSVPDAAWAQLDRLVTFQQELHALLTKHMGERGASILTPHVLQFFRDVGQRLQAIQAARAVR